MNSFTNSILLLLMSAGTDRYIPNVFISPFPDHNRAFQYYWLGDSFKVSHCSGLYFQIILSAYIFFTGLLLSADTVMSIRRQIFLL